VLGSAALAPTVNQSAPVGPTITASHDKPSSTTTIAWPTEVVAGPFNVYRGTITTGSAFAYNQTCFANMTSSPTPDPAVPASMTTYYYLVTRKTSCGESGLGEQRPDRPADPLLPAGRLPSRTDGRQPGQLPPDLQPVAVDATACLARLRQCSTFEHRLIDTDNNGIGDVCQ
jgi:hypothetical protein